MSNSTKKLYSCQGLYQLGEIDREIGLHIKLIYLWSGITQVLFLSVKEHNIRLCC